MTKSAGRGVLPVLGGVVALYLIVPIVAFAVRLAGPGNRGFGTPGLWSSAAVSVVTATIALGLVCFFGIPLAYVLARAPGRFARIVTVAVQLPLALPPLIGGILLVYIVGPYTSVGRFFGSRLTESVAGIVIAQTFVAAPFLIGVAKAAFGAVDPALYDVARTLRYGELARFARVGVPAARGAIRAGMVLAWLRAFGEYGAIAILAYHPYSLPVFTYLQFGSVGLSNTEAPTAMAIAIAAIAITLGQVRFPTVRRAPLPLPAPVAPSVRHPSAISFVVEASLASFQLDIAHYAASGRLAILGPSGAGKSVTLRGMAGLLPGRTGNGTLEVGDRRTDGLEIGYVPQGLGLFPHLRVRDQLVAGRRSDPALAAYWADRLGITPLLGRFPGELSGGERQRVSLARTFGRDPDILLLDEPFSALDTPVRVALRRDVRAMQRDAGVPSIVVTHDPEEAAMLADEILVMTNGRLLQSGTVREVFDRPASPQVARLLGIDNVFAATAGAGGTVAVGDQTICLTSIDAPVGRALSWCVRAEAVALGRGSSRGVVRDLVDRGSGIDAIVEIGSGVSVRVACGRQRPPAIGSAVDLDIPSDAVTVWLGDPGTDPT